MKRKVDTSLIKLGENLSVSPNIATSRTAAYGANGSGKTYFVSKLNEELLRRGGWVIILDPQGIHWGLRLDKSGKKPSGINIVVFGGDHGDIPLLPESGIMVADLLTSKRISAVLDVSEFSDSELNTFATAFGNRFFMNMKKKPRAVLLEMEEAQEFIPQNPMKEETRKLHAFNRITKMGRGHGIGVLLITPRPQDVSKKTSNLVQNMFAFQMTGTHERKSIADWCDYVHLNMDLSKLLPTLEPGQPFVASPSYLKFTETTRILPKTTWDSSATPEFGADASESVKLTNIDISQIEESMRSIIQEQKENDPTLLKKEIARLKREATASVKVVQEPMKIEVIKTVEVQTFRAGEVERLQASAQKLIEFGNSILLKIKFPAPGPVISLNQPPTLTRIPVPLKHKPLLQNLRTLPDVDVAGADKKKMGKAEKSILKVLAQYPNGRTMNQIAVLAGYAVSGGGFTNALSACRTNGYMTGENTGTLSITQQGLEYIGNDWEPLPTGSDLQKYWMGKLPHAERSILKTLVMFNYPKEMALDFIAENTMSARGGPYEVSGGGFTNAISGLRTRELITGKTLIKASDTLFD